MLACMYRDQHFTCPRCKTGLRPFAARLVCDTCTRMQLPDADFKRSIEDLTGATVKLDWQAGITTAHPCPQCTQPLGEQRFTIDVVDQYIVDPQLDVERCSEHGVWIAAKLLADVFTTVERRVHKGRASNGLPTRRWLSDD
jgi:hypothetical protein